MPPAAGGAAGGAVEEPARGLSVTPVPVAGRREVRLDAAAAASALEIVMFPGGGPLPAPCGFFQCLAGRLAELIALPMMSLRALLTALSRLL